MSGTAGIVNFDRAPIDRDGKTWITGNVRLDGRRDLIAKLKLSDSPDDAELVLHAYRVWKEDCVKHLIGDFAFAIWDGTRQQLFCARDQMGVRQFFYSYANDTFIFSNTLESLRNHVAGELNELAIGDFLVFGLNQDPATTIFARIRRLPKAHTLIVSRDGIRINEYWTPTTSTIRYKTDADYVEHFNELLTCAVADRLRTENAGILMSGGLDSSAIAAIVRRQRPALDLKAFCVVYDSAFPDEERKYATIVARNLDIPIEFLPGNEINQQDGWENIGSAPEPFDVDPVYLVSGELLRRSSSHSRVALTGWDGDTFLSETPRHSFSHSLKTGNLPRLVYDLARFVYFQHGPPPIGIRTRWRRWRHPHWNRSPYPVWLNEDFSRRLHLRERWRDLNARNAPAHPLRPRVFSTLYSPHWDALMSRHDAGTTLLPLEVRHPLIDVRLVDYLLGLPVIPWLLDKTILRKAMVGVLPDAVRMRPKSPLAGDPGLLLRHTRKFQEIDEFKPVSAIRSYVDRESIPRVTNEVNSTRLSINVRPFCLNQWLAYSQ